MTPPSAAPPSAAPSLAALDVDLTTPRAELLLALGDDDLIWGQRASHWTGVAPSLEEDLAFSTIAQDAINHADLWYQTLLGPELTGEDLRAGVDALGLGRAPDGYRHAIVCEREPVDFARTLARHWAIVHAVTLRLDVLGASTDDDLAALARKLRHEERYHLEHADHWFGRLAHDPGEGRTRLADALAAELPAALGLFEPTLGEDVVVADGTLPVPAAVLRERWLEHVTEALGAAALGELVPTELPAAAAGGRTGRHTGDFTDGVWPEMTALHRAHPGARW